VPVRKRNGEYIWVEASLRVVRQPNRRSFKVLNIVRDIPSASAPSSNSRKPTMPWRRSP